MSERAPSVEIIGLPEFRARLAKLADAVAERALVRAATAGALIVQNAAKENAPYKTGTLRRSIHTETAESSREKAEVDIGTDVPYAARIEYGFSGADSLGRIYNQPARPYLRPALDDNIAEVTEEIRAALEELIEAALR